jgi:hypothetical protein
MKTPLALCPGLVGMLPVAQAGLIEDLLSRPALQALIGQPDLKALLQRCTDANNERKNLSVCRQVDEANRLARIPLEVCTLMASPASAASSRELCLAAQATSACNSYLCKELASPDLDFAVIAKNADMAWQQLQVQDQQVSR